MSYENSTFAGVEKCFRNPLTKFPINLITAKLTLTLGSANNFLKKAK